MRVYAPDRLGLSRAHEIRFRGVVSPAESSTAGLLQELRSEEHTSELQSPCNLVCRLLLVKKNEARARLRIAGVLRLLNYEPLRLVGQRGRGCCPLHDALAPCGCLLAVHWQEHIFHCSVCGA